MFVSFDSIENGSAVLVELADEESIEINDTPDMVLEVVSKSSVRKDTIVLRDLYWQAGIPEYWLVDARVVPVSFELLKLGPKGYTTTRKTAGSWQKSGVFGRSFRIVQETDQLGNPRFTLEVKL